jgi:hypothetical protein
MRYNWGRGWTVFFDDGEVRTLGYNRDVRDFKFYHERGILLMGFDEPD